MKTKLITRTAILLALAIVFQMAGRFLGPQNNLIVGPLVNAILLVAAEITGLWGGITIAVVAPLVSALTNKAPIAPLVLSFSPFIIAGNAILVLAYYYLRNKSRIAGVGAGAVLKFAFLFGAITMFVDLMKLPPKVATVLTGLFGWPQLLTAAIGGVVALAILRALKKALKD